MINVRGFIGIFFVELLVLFISGSKIVLETNPAQFNPLLTHSLVIRCAVEDSSSTVVGRSINKRQQSQSGHTIVHPIKDDVTFVSSLILLKDGLDISSVSEHIPAKLLIEAANVVVKGNVTGRAGERAYLEMTLDHPTQSQSENYTCKIAGYDSVGHSVTAATSIVVRAMIPTIDDLVSAIYANEIQHKADVDQLESDHHAELAKLEAEYKAAVANVTTELIAQSAKITSLSDQMTTLFHVEEGVVDCGNIAPLPVYVDRHTLFKTPYASSPMVHVALLDARFLADKTAGLEIEVISVDGAGFTLRCSSDMTYNRDFYAGLVRVAWMSVPKA